MIATSNLVMAMVRNRIKTIPISGTVAYSDANVIEVPQFLPPPMDWANALVEVKHPVISPNGQAGGSYLQRVEVEVAVFYRVASDPWGRWHQIVSDLEERMWMIRQYLTGQHGGILPIPLFESGTQQPQAVRNEEGQLVKWFIWTAARLWGLAAQEHSDFAAA